MERNFRDNPILNSPFYKPEEHWLLDKAGSPMGPIIRGRRESGHLVPIPATQRRKREEANQLIEDERKEEKNKLVNEIREQVDEWRAKNNQGKWGVTYVTRRLLEHWREGRMEPRLFFCQVEAAETFIWLNEVAPNTAAGKRILDKLEEVNKDSNSQLLRYAAKMATGAGKTTVMAMLIAYHTINKAQSPRAKKFSNNFLIITPGITIKDRLRVLLPSDPSQMYVTRGIVPSEFTREISRARVVITNYHTFKPREKMNVPKIGQDILTGTNDKEFSSKETEGEMLVRACKELIRSDNVIVINDEAHHCYRRKESADDEGKDKKKSKKIPREESEEIEAEEKKNKEAARIWISGIEALGRKVELKCVYDLSATPFFLRGSGYAEGRLFPWVTSDFSLMDAIESGIVKVPRVPIDDGTMSADDLPVYRNLYRRVGRDLPKMGRRNQGPLDPQDLPSKVQGALEALYKSYQATHAVWDEGDAGIPPVFIIVCNNTSTSEMVFNYISGYESLEKEGHYIHGAFELFDNIDKNGEPFSRPFTLLIDSEQLDSGGVMNDDFKKVAKDEIEIFKKERETRSRGKDPKKLTDEELLREVMNTVGKKGYLGEQIRCVVSVSMLTEGWDTNNVTHILGVRAFGTQLLCEQVVGRGLRRQSYDIDAQNPDARFTPEYADVFGVPFAFAQTTKVEKPDQPNPPYRVWALDERAHLAISFPRVRSYALKIPDEKLVANFDKNSILKIRAQDAPPKTRQQGIVGKGEILTLDDLRDKHRKNEVVYHLAAETFKLFKNDKKYEDKEVPPSVFRDLVPIVRHWMKHHLKCFDQTFEQYLLWREFAVKAAERIHRACAPKYEEGSEIYIPIVDKFTPEGSSFHVNFMTSKKRRHKTNESKCHINYAVCDSDWELDFCIILEEDPNVYSYVRNDRLGFEVPYTYKKEAHRYFPDFIAKVDDGRGIGDLLNLVIEIKGKRGDKARVKADTMNRLWVPSVNTDGRWGRWAFEEITNPIEARDALEKYTKSQRGTE